MPHSPESLSTLNRICIEECGDPLVDITKLCPKIRLMEGRSPLLRKTAAEMLAKVCDELPKGILFYVSRAFRSLEDQTVRWDHHRSCLKDKHPHWPDMILNRETNKVYAPYNQKTPPPHSTGGAIDLYFMREDDGAFLDLMPPLENWAEGYTKSKLIAPELQKLRDQLCEMMERHGFSNYPLEYWHYSYGDSAWAARHGRKTCIYGAATPEMIESATQQA